MSLRRSFSTLSTIENLRREILSRSRGAQRASTPSLRCQKPGSRANLARLNISLKTSWRSKGRDSIIASRAHYQVRPPRYFYRLKRKPEAEEAKVSAAQLCSGWPTWLFGVSLDMPNLLSEVSLDRMPNSDKWSVYGNLSGHSGCECVC